MNAWSVPQLTAGEREEDVLEFGTTRGDAAHTVTVCAEPAQQLRARACELGDADVQARSLLGRPRDAGRCGERGQIDGAFDLELERLDGRQSLVEARERVA